MRCIGIKTLSTANKLARNTVQYTRYLSTTFIDIYIFIVRSGVDRKLFVEFFQFFAGQTIWVPISIILESALQLFDEEKGVVGP